MVTICLGFFDLCLPASFSNTANNTTCQSTEQAHQSPHDRYWNTRCEAFPTASGCKLYDS